MNKTKSNKEKSCRQVITPKSGNRTGRATPTLFGRVSGCVHFFGAGWSPSPCKGFEAVFGSCLRLFGGRKSKQDKQLASSVAPCSVTSARSAGSYGVFREFQSGVKIEGVLSLLRSLSLKAYTHKKKVGVIPRKGAHFEQERKICPLSHS